MSAPQLRAHTVHTLEDRVRILRRLVWAPEGGLRDPLMRRLGLAVTNGVKARDDMGELEAIFDFVVKNVRYSGDIAGKDTFQTALRTLQFGAGDCDDNAVCCAALAMENGFESKFRITSNQGTSWDHILAMAAIPKHKPSKWIALDTTLGPGRFGRQPPMAKYRDFAVGSGT